MKKILIVLALLLVGSVLFADPVTVDSDMLFKYEMERQEPALYSLLNAVPGLGIGSLLPFSYAREENARRLSAILGVEPTGFSVGASLPLE